MKKLLFSALALLVASLPFSSMAGMGAEENINIYGWQNYSWERVDNGTREFDRINGNAANIGFMAHMDTGVPGWQVGLRCEQFTFHNRLTSSGWCNRNSKISLRHETMGEFMFGQWLLPYNEIVAQWVDPFYDAGADSHTSIMGNVGFGSEFYNGGTFPFDKADFAYNGVFSLSFNRRQEEVIQYVWPNTAAMADQSRDGFQFRFAMTSGFNDETDVVAGNSTYNLDPRIWSTGASWQYNTMGGGQIWLAAAYERHDEWTAFELSRQFGNNQVCSDSEDDGWRIAGRYTHNWGNGMNTMIAAMWEELDYDADNCIHTKTDPDLDKGIVAGGAATNLWNDVDREAWMISGKHNFGNGFAAKFSYMDADDLDCGESTCGGAVTDDGDTDADAWNVGLTYTMPAGTELRVTYSDVDNSDQSDYDFGIGSTGNAQGEDVDMWAIGIVHWFD